MTKFARGCAFAFLMLSMVVVAFVAYIDAGLARNFNNTPYFVLVLMIQVAFLVLAWRSSGHRAIWLAIIGALGPPIAYYELAMHRLV